jgi:NADH-quinone oxidoreductase subunit N
MNLVVPDVNLLAISPMLIVALGAIVVLLAELIVPARWRQGLIALSLLALLAALYAARTLWDANLSAFHNMILADNYGLFLALVVILGAAVSLLLAVDYVHARGLELGEFNVLLLAATSGMLIMATANDLIVIFLGLEVLSLSLYILAAFNRRDTLSLEAGIKYFLLGVFASAFFLYGIALVYGATATTNLTRLAAFVAQNPIGGNVLLQSGAGLLVVGFGFKVALVPFQWWTPDVYEGAPTPVTAFMSVGVKVAAFAAFFRAFLFAFGSATTLPFDWQTLLAILAVLTMTVGNVAAVVQSNIKRMLAYSSIAHAGYILIALVAGGASGISAALFYLLAYTLTNLGAFAAVISLGDDERERLVIADYGGVGQTHPLRALALTICLLSLAGFPPLAGFVGKFFVFSAAVQNNGTWLAIVGVLNSLVSVYFYLRPVIAMYIREPVPGFRTARVPALLVVALIIAVVGVILLGLFPANTVTLAQGTGWK